MKNKWFDEVLIPSIISRILENKKYPNSLILSEKQVNVCRRYMERKEEYNLYGKWFSFYEYHVDGFNLTLLKRGRYYIIYLTKVATQKQLEEAREIMKKINENENKLDILYGENGEKKEENKEEIERIEKIVDDLWDEYNKKLEV